METHYASEVHYKKNQQTVLSIKLVSIQVFDEEMCNRFIERVKKEFQDAREESLKLTEEDFLGRLSKTYESSAYHRIKKESLSPCQNHEVGLIDEKKLVENLEISPNFSQNHEVGLVGMSEAFVAE